MVDFISYGMTEEEYTEAIRKTAEFWNSQSEVNKFKGAAFYPTQHRDPEIGQKGAGGEFDESEHPRGADGKFTEKGEGESSTEEKTPVVAVMGTRNSGRMVRVYARNSGVEVSNARRGSGNITSPEIESEYKQVIKKGGFKTRNNDMKVDEFDLGGLKVNVNYEDIPNNLQVKLDRLKIAFDYSNIPLEQRPTIEFLGRTTEHDTEFTGADGQKYQCSYAAVADYYKNIISIYDDNSPANLIDHEVGHFEQHEEQLEYVEFPEKAYGLKNVTNIDDYKKMVTILNEKKIITSDLIYRLQNDEKYRKDTGVMDAMNEAGLELDPKYMNIDLNGFTALDAIAIRTAAKRSLEVDADTEKAFKSYRKPIDDHLKVIQRRKEWTTIYKAEPYTDIYSGQNENETFAQAYSDVVETIRRYDYSSKATKFVPVPPYPHPDDSEWAIANPLKYKYMKTHILTKFISKKGV